MFGRSLNKYTSNERKPVQIFPWVEKKKTSLHLAHKWNSFFLKHQFWCVLRHQFHTWSLVSKDLFWSLQAVLLKEAKRLYFFVTIEFFVSITFATKLVHRRKKKNMRRQLIVAFEKQTLKLQWKEDKIIRGKANSYFRRLSGRFRKNEEISKVVYFFSFGLKLKMKLVETVSVSIGVKFRQTSYASKTN